MASPAEADSRFRIVDARFAVRLFQAMFCMAAISLAISFGGKTVGHELALGGHETDRSLREIVTGNDVLRIPANMIRHERARAGGAMRRVDLYLQWPSMEGYSDERRDDFNNAGPRRTLLFLAVEERQMTRDMSGRLEPIYARLLAPTAEPSTGEMRFRDFLPNSGFVNERLVIAGSGPDFVARCLVGDAARDSLAPCERDIHVGRNLSLTYRFPEDRLSEWKTLEAEVRKLAERLIAD